MGGGGEFGTSESSPAGVAQGAARATAADVATVPRGDRADAPPPADRAPTGLTPLVWGGLIVVIVAGVLIGQLR